MLVSLLKKKGRPCKLQETSYHLTKKKEILFGHEPGSNAQYMSLVNIAYHTNKITEEEKDIAIYLEHLYFHVKKGLGVKSIPKAAPNTWNARMRASFNSLTKNQEQAIRDWNSMKLFVQKFEPRIANEFLNLICSHHAYEELLALKLNYQVMNVLKQGLICVRKMFDF